MFSDANSSRRSIYSRLRPLPWVANFTYKCFFPLLSLSGVFINEMKFNSIVYIIVPGSSTNVVYRADDRNDEHDDTMH